MKPAPLLKPVERPQWSVDKTAPQTPAEGTDAPPGQGTEAGVWQ